MVVTAGEEDETNRSAVRVALRYPFYPLGRPDVGGYRLCRTLVVEILFFRRYVRVLSLAGSLAVFIGEEAAMSAGSRTYLGILIY